MKKVTRKTLSLLLSLAMVFGMVQGIGILPVFAADVPTSVSIGPANLSGGKYYSENLVEMDIAPTDGTPYLYYSGGVLTVTGDWINDAGVNLISIAGGTLTMAGSGSFTLQSSGMPCVDFQSDAQLVLSGDVDFSVKSTTAIPVMSNGSFKTADGYSGNIRLEGEGSVLSLMKGIDLNTTGSIGIYGKGSAPIVSCDESIQMTGASIDIQNTNLSDPASNGILVSGAKDLSMTATVDGVNLKATSNYPILDVGGNITLSAAQNVRVLNFNKEKPGVNWKGSKFAITASEAILVQGQIIGTGDQPNVAIETTEGSENMQLLGGISLGSNGTCTVKSNGSIEISGEGDKPVFSGKTLTLDADKAILVHRENDSVSSNVPIIAANEQQLTSKNSAVIVSGSAGSTIKTNDGQTIQAAFGGYVTNDGLNLSTPPKVATLYLAGDGYILYTPAQGAAPATLALTNATIDTSDDDAITLPGTAVTIELSGKNILRSNADVGSGIEGTGSLTITSSNGGTLDMEAIAYALSFEKAYGKTITIGGNASVTAVSHNGPAVMTGGNLTVEPNAKFAAKGMMVDVVLDGAFHAPNFNGSVVAYNQTVTPKTYDFTIYSACEMPGMLAVLPLGTSQFGVTSLQIPSSSQMTIPSSSSLMVTDMTKLKLEGKIINNGIIYLPIGTTVDQIKAMNLTGTGFVFVSESIDSNGMPSKDKGIAYTNDGTALKTVSGGLNLATGDHSGATLENDGYTWTKSGEGDSEVWTLTLNHTYIDGTLTLPDKAVVINTTADSFISNGIMLGSKLPGNLTFTGSGSLTVNGRISGSQGGSVTVAEKANVIVRDGINVGTSGGINGALIVNGTLTASNEQGTVIYTGKAEIGPVGILNVTGTVGLKLCGMNYGGGTDYNNAFVIKKGGKLNANCTDANVTVFTDTNKATKDNASKVIVLPDGYLPNGYEIAVVSGINGQTQYAYTIAPKGAALTLEAEQVMGAGGKLTLEKPLPIVSGVTVSPSTVSVNKGISQVFSADVTGKYGPSKSVTWSISGNKSPNTTIDQNGKLTVAADETASAITVKATSADDTEKFGTATVTVTGSTENGGNSNNGGSGTNPAQPVPPQPQAPAADSNKNPQTSDDLNAALLLRFLVICIGGIAVVLQTKYLKKGKHA